MTPPQTDLRCAGLSALPGPPAGGIRSCPRAPSYLVQDVDELRPREHACGHHLGWLVRRMVERFGPVTVETVR